jgi:outer membrane protein TolC
MLTVSSVLVTACRAPDFASLRKNASTLIQTNKTTGNIGNSGDFDVATESTKPLREVLNGSLAAQNDGVDFQSVMRSALTNDPAIIVQRRILKAKKAAIDSSEAQKDFQIASTLYGGLDDITDAAAGVAVGVNASRIIFDGGMLDAQIAVKTFTAKVAELELATTVNERAYRLGVIWLELEKYKTLQKQIDDRLSVLDPLIGQLEQIAKAGIGDVTKVTAAQRTVSDIKVKQTNISEGLAKAELEFESAFGLVDKRISYDFEFVTNLLPGNIDPALAERSPLLLSKYEKYKAALANLAAVGAKDDFNIGFEASALRPLGDSDNESDESIGFVARKTLFNGGLLESELGEAEAMAQAAVSDIEVTYRQGVRIVQSAVQSIDSMEKAIILARENAKVTSDEILYLRQQLVIGGSTLDSVLSAEARLYDAQSKEIMFMVDKRIAELTIVNTAGLLGVAFGL